MEFWIVLSLFCFGYFFGSANERRHYNSIKTREKDLLGVPATTTKKYSSQRRVKKAELLTGSVVVSLDYFKRILAGLRNIFGGNVGSYETLVDRARREAVLRLREQAKGADIVANMRIETSTIGSNANERKTIGSIEALAYGTAIWYE